MYIVNTKTLVKTSVLLLNRFPQRYPTLRQYREHKDHDPFVEGARFRPMALEHAMIDEAVVDAGLSSMIVLAGLSRRP